MTARPWLTMWCDVPMCGCWDSVSGGAPTIEAAEAGALSVGWTVAGKNAKAVWSCPRHKPGGSMCPHDGARPTKAVPRTNG